MSAGTSLIGPTSGLLLAAFGGYGLSLLITWLWSVSAPRLGFLDQPGARRLHRQPVPRGGGVGIVAVVVLALLSIEPLAEGSQAVALAVLALAGTGLYDDWRGAGVALRIVVQLLAALILAAACFADAEGARLILMLPIATLLSAAWINVVNFMDGANGMAAQQALFLATILMVFAGIAGETPWMLFALALGGAVLGFLPFNLPRARVFLGDVGSTTLGFALALPAAALIASGVLSLGEAALAASAFLIDSAATWIGRVSRGRGWYTPHREHLYQWLVRSGYSHLQVAALYATWNLLVVVPLLAVGRLVPQAQPLCALIGWILGLSLWCLGRSHALARVRARSR
jgi:Fuc2NAc and GlcNAc transferase